MPPIETLFGWVFWVASLLYILPYALFALLSLVDSARRRITPFELLRPQGGEWPRVSVVVPSYNEGVHLLDSIQSLLGIEYPNLDMIVVDDGSRDTSFLHVQLRHGLLPLKLAPSWDAGNDRAVSVWRSARAPYLTVLRQRNGGKASAMNTALRYASGRYFLTLDADSVLGLMALKRLVTRLEADPRAAAAGGVVRIRDGCLLQNGQVREVGLPRRWIHRFQVLEYLRSFMVARYGMSRLHALVILAGAFTLFRTSALREVGGFSQTTVGEDFEASLRLLRLHRPDGRRARLLLEPHAICWTAAPDHRKVFMRQRRRWQRGCLESLWFNRGLLFAPRFGLLGLFVLPWFMVFEGLEALIESTGIAFTALLLLFGAINVDAALWILGAVYVLNVMSSQAAVWTEILRPGPPPKVREVGWLMLLALVEPFVHRPFDLLARLRGSMDFLLRREARWGNMGRAGKMTAALPAPTPAPAPQQAGLHGEPPKARS